MPIIVPNAWYQTTKQQGRVKILNPTRNTLPKAGRNGSSSQFSADLVAVVGDVPTKHGNTFGHNGYAERAPIHEDQKNFGQRSRVSIATGRSVAPSYIDTKGKHPNAHFFDVARQVKRAPTQPGSPGEDNSNPAGVFKGQANSATTTMPHQRNGIGANQGKNLSKRAVYRASAGGASKVLPSDTPFHKLAVKRKPSLPETIGVPEAPDSSSRRAGPRSGKVSFFSDQNLWYDPNASFQTGAVNTQTGRVGKGRWQMIKRGAAG